MGKLRFFISLIFARAAFLFLRITKLSAGTSVIGLMVLKICPDFLKYANGCISDKKVNITGTNGKTTTSGLISHMIKSSGKSVINNAMGANMLNGVVNALALKINPFMKTDCSVIELDEANVEPVYKSFDADYLLVTNLFRDQLDRYGELTTTRKFIQNGIDLKKDLTLILNGDDPLVAGLEAKNKIYYGIKDVSWADGVKPVESKTEETFTCSCGRNLNYTKKFYAQQGHYYCDCGYKRPDIKYEASVVMYRDYSIINIDGVDYKVPLVGLFNAYNALGAIVTALELGLKNIQNSLLSFKVAFGRSEVKTLNKKRTLIQLIKNPVGANEVLKTVDIKSNLLIIINDNYADGRDISWLWDAEFELLKNVTNPIVVSGTRAKDMALRLKYAGIKSDKITVIENIKKAVDFIGKEAESDIIILPTYTALLKLNKLKELKKCYLG